MFVGKSVIANYGNKKTYIVNDVDFENGPTGTFFDMRDGQKISVAKYFYKTYNRKITEKRQPMLIVRAQGHNCSIPSEFCIIDGVPDSIRSNPGSMRELLGKVRQNPSEKLNSIKGMIKNLLQGSSKLEEFDISIDTTPQSLESRKLKVPELVHKEGDDQKLYACERLLKQMYIYSSQLEEYHIIFLYDRYQRNEADNA